MVPQLESLLTTGCRLGWSDIALFAIFKNWHIPADWVNFNSSSIPKKSAIWRIHGKDSLFSKNRRDLKKLYFFWKIANTFFLLQRTIVWKNVERKTFLEFCVGKIVFDVVKGKLLFSFFSFLALKKSKETFPPEHALKTFLKRNG